MEENTLQPGAEEQNKPQTKKTKKSEEKKAKAKRKSGLNILSSEGGGKSNNNNNASKRPPYLRDAFNMIDKDRSGFIDAEELSLLLKLQGINASKDDVKNIFETYHSSSTNGDELSFDEFCVIM